MPPSPENPPARGLRPLALGLIFTAMLVHFLVAVSAGLNKSATIDEIAHLTGGFAYNHLQDYRIHPENGVLTQRWQALGLGPLQPQFPALENREWKDAVTFMVSYRFFYENGNDPEAFLRAGRRMNALLGVATLGLIALLAWRLFGPMGSLFSTLMASASPTLIAHSSLATSDMAMTFFFIASVSAFWRHLHDGRLRILALSAGLFGVACGAKFSAILLLPMFALLALIRVGTGPAVQFGPRQFRTRRERTGFIMGSLLIHAIAAWGIIWAFYGFRYSAFAPGLPVNGFTTDWNALLPVETWENQTISILRRFRVLPEAFLYGFTFVLAHSHARGAFLDGELGTTGWWDFFPKTFVYKSTPIEIALVAAILLFIWWNRRRQPAHRHAFLLRIAPLMVLGIVYAGVSIFSHLNIGHRHILPLYPILFIISGVLLPGTGSVISKRSLVPVGFAAVLLAQAASSFSIHPHYLAYFNTLSGGPEHGYQRLVDSSLDWGQDLPLAAELIHTGPHFSGPTYLSYFGSGEPAHYGIEATLLPRFPPFMQPRPWHTLESGRYIISATMLQHVYSPAHHPWKAEDESQFQTLRPLEPQFLAFESNPAAHPDLLGQATAGEWTNAWNLYENLRFARLCHYLSIRPPDAMLGYSLLVFDLTPAEIEAAVHGDIHTFAEALESAARRPFAPVLAP